MLIVRVLLENFELDWPCVERNATSDRSFAYTSNMHLAGIDYTQPHTHTQRKHLDFIALWHQILTYLCNYWMLVPQMPALCSIWLLSNATSWMISYRPHVSNDFNEHLIRSLSASVGACITCTKCVCNEVAIWRISMRGI